MNYLLKSSLITENTCSRIIFNDQALRLIPILKTQIHTCNELVTGPCVENIKIFADSADTHLFSLLKRPIDNITHPIYK